MGGVGASEGVGGDGFPVGGAGEEVGEGMAARGAG